MSNKLGHWIDNGKKLKWIIGTHGNWRNQNSGAILELPAKQHYQLTYSPRKWAKWAELAMLFSLQLQNGPHDFDFFNCHGANYSFELISSVHWIPQFFMHNKSILPIDLLRSIFFDNLTYHVVFCWHFYSLKKSLSS